VERTLCPKYCEGFSILGQEQLTNTGTATLKPTLPAGEHRVKAAFHGTTEVAGRESRAELIVERENYHAVTAISFSEQPGTYPLMVTDSIFRYPHQTGAMYSLFRTIELIARGIAFTPGAIWITGCDRNDCGITRIDARNDQIVTTIRTAKAPFGIASVESAVWVTNPDENSVSRINPATNQIVATIPVGEVPTAIAVGEGAVWVINTRNKSVSRIDPQTIAREMVVEVEHSTLGSVKTIGLPIKFSQTPGKVRSGAPLYGEHTSAILGAYGFDADEIAALHEEGAIAAAEFAKDEVG